MRDYQSIGQLIRDLRAASGISQTKLAEMMGLSYQQIQKYEKGLNLTVSRLAQIADILGVSLQTLLNDQNVTRAAESKVPYTVDTGYEQEVQMLRLYRKLKGRRLKSGVTAILEEAGQSDDL